MSSDSSTSIKPYRFLGDFIEIGSEQVIHRSSIRSIVWDAALDREKYPSGGTAIFHGHDGMVVLPHESMTDEQAEAFYPNMCAWLENPVN